MPEISTLELANSMIHSVLVQEQFKIIEEFHQNVKIKDYKDAKMKSRNGNNYKPRCYRESEQGLSINDYRNYVWNTLKINENIYWITLFFNNVDKETGNPHSQFGRIQFWKNVVPHKNEKQCFSPHRKGKLSDENNKKVHWCFCEENAEDPHLWIDSPDYSPEEVVKRFCKFLKKNGEEVEYKKSGVNFCFKGIVIAMEDKLETEEQNK